MVQKGQGDISRFILEKLLFPFKMVREKRTCWLTPSLFSWTECGHTVWVLEQPSCDYEALSIRLKRHQPKMAGMKNREKNSVSLMTSTSSHTNTSNHLPLVFLLMRHHMFALVKPFLTPTTYIQSFLLKLNHTSVFELPNRQQQQKRDTWSIIICHCP